MKPTKELKPWVVIGVVLFAVALVSQVARAGECTWCEEKFLRFRCENAPQDQRGHTQCEAQNDGLDPCRMSGDVCTGGGGDEDAWGSVKDDFRLEDTLGDLSDPCSDDSFCPAECASCSR